MTTEELFVRSPAALGFPWEEADFRHGPKAASRWAQYKEWRKTEGFQDWWNAKYEDQMGFCYYCYQPLAGKEVNVDHVRCLRKGGTNRLNNLVLACSGCNRLKGGKFLDKQTRVRIRLQFNQWIELKRRIIT